MVMAREIRVLLVDDNTIFRQALRTALEAFHNIQIVDEVNDGEAAVVSAAKLQPTAIVMDISMPRMDGITATRLIKKQNPQIVVVGLSVDPKDYQIYAMEKAGATKVIDKDSAVTELYGALQEAVAAVQPVLIMQEAPVPKQALEDYPPSHTKESISQTQPVEGLQSSQDKGT
jgi:DNA-binding NarL/FixJ family response regulator